MHLGKLLRNGIVFLSSCLAVITPTISACTDGNTGSDAPPADGSIEASVDGSTDGFVDARIDGASDVPCCTGAA